VVKQFIEAVVNYGEFPAFAAATERYQKLAVEHGLEPYALWANQGGGRMNEVFFEATFDSPQALIDREKADGEHADLMEALGEILRHCVPGSIIDRQLTPV
jgi:hypothetical protein